jgi:GrpB-like predicted nucleotidyltransferase (UPF0157 family)
MKSQRRVEVFPPNPVWREQYHSEAKRLQEAFGESLSAIHHIGSTAIQGIYTKPVIDILVEVQDIERILPEEAAVVALGYEGRGEYGIPGRRYFRRGDYHEPTFHVHVFQHDHPAVHNHLNFRDYLNAHPERAQDYSRLKQALTRQFPQDIERYMAGKDGLIKQILEEAAQWRAGTTV